MFYVNLTRYRVNVAQEKRNELGTSGRDGWANKAHSLLAFRTFLLRHRSVHEPDWIVGDGASAIGCAVRTVRIEIVAYGQKPPCDLGCDSELFPK